MFFLLFGYIFFFYLFDLFIFLVGVFSSIYFNSYQGYNCRPKKVEDKNSYKGVFPPGQKKEDSAKGKSPLHDLE